MVNSSRELLALRREVLVARASLERLRVAAEIDALRASLAWPRAAGAIAASPRARAVVFGALLLAIGRGRLGRFLGLAAAVVGLVRLVRNRP